MLCLNGILLELNMIIETIKKDIFQPVLDSEFDLFAHGCNCFHSFGKGIALSVKDTFPKAYVADKATAYGSKDKLGTYSFSDYDCVKVINAYTQFNYGYGKRNADYNAIKKVFETLNLEYPGLTLAIPKIGAGLAKGDWNIIQDIINDSTPDLKVSVFYL